MHVWLRSHTAIVHQFHLHTPLLNIHFPTNHEFTIHTTNAIMLADLVWSNSQPEVFYIFKKKK